MAELIPKSGYRPAYIGLSTEDKGDLENVTPGSTFEEADTGLEFVYTGEAWYLRPGQALVMNSAQGLPTSPLTRLGTDANGAEDLEVVGYLSSGTILRQVDTGKLFAWDATTKTWAEVGQASGGSGQSTAMAQRQQADGDLHLAILNELVLANDRSAGRDDRLESQRALPGYEELYRNRR